MNQTHSIDVLITSEQIAARVSELAAEIANSFYPSSVIPAQAGILSQRIEKIPARRFTPAKAGAGMTKNDDDIMIISLLRGSFVFTADLIRALHLSGARPQVDFMTLASYGNSTTSSGNVQIIRDITEDVKGRNVLIVDDILESGGTLTFARNLIKERGAETIKIAVMLEKPNKRKNNINADFVGFTIPDKFVVGYGLDYANYYRELPFIGVLEG